MLYDGVNYLDDNESFSYNGRITFGDEYKEYDEFLKIIRE